MVAVAAAAAAAAVSVAGTVATTAIKSRAAHGAAKGIPSAIPPSVRENQFNFATQDIMNEERGVMENALAQGDAIQPELYKALGLDPIYSDNNTHLDQLNQQAQGISDKLNALQSALAGGKAGKGKAGKAGMQAIFQQFGVKNRAELTRLQTSLTQQLTAAQQQLGQAKTMPRTVIGFNRMSGIPDPTGSAGGGFAGALNDYDQHAAAAMAGKNPIDPTLLHQFDLQEQAMRTAMEAQLGPDWQNSSAGIKAMSDFAQRKSEAIAAYNEQAVVTYSGLAESRAAALSSLTSAKMKALMAPGNETANLGLALGSAAEGRVQEQSQLSIDRARMGGQNINAANIRGGYNLAGADALAGGVGTGASQIGAGIASGGATLANALANTNASLNSPTNIPPGYGGYNPGVPGPGTSAETISGDNMSVNPAAGYGG